MSYNHSVTIFTCKEKNLSKLFGLVWIVTELQKCLMTMTHVENVYGFEISIVGDVSTFVCLMIDSGYATSLFGLQVACDVFEQIQGYHDV